MKKILWVPIIALALLTACNSESKDEENVNSEAKEITYWQHSSAARDDLIKAIAKDFEDSNPGVKVNLEFIPESDYNQKLITALATDSAPSVFQVQSGMVKKLVDAGSIQPLDELIVNNDMIENEFIEATVSPLKIDEKYYGLPTDTQTILTFWNKEIYEEIGLDSTTAPQTWDDFFSIAREIIKEENGKMVRAGWGTVGYDREVESFVVQHGGKFFDSDNQKFVFAEDKKSMDAINKLATVYREDRIYSTDLGDNPWQGFRQNMVGQMLGHPAMIGNLPTTAPSLDFGVGLIPAASGEHLSTLTSWAYTTSANAPQELSTKFIEYLTSEEIQKKWTQETGELPARKSLLEDEDLLANEKITVGLESLKSSFPSSLQTGALNKIWTEHYQRVLLTDESIETIMQECQKALNDELNKSF